LKAPHRSVALALMVAAPVLWSTAGVVTRHLERATAFEQVFWRSLFAGVFVAMTLFIFMKRNPWRAVRDAGWPGLLSAALWGVMFTAFMLALSLTTTANTLVVMSISPLLTVLLARLVLSDPVPLRTWFAAAAAGPRQCDAGRGRDRPSGADQQRAGGNSARAQRCVNRFAAAIASIAKGHAYADRGLVVVIVDQSLAIAGGELDVEL
jgi:hypothetical protein